VIERYFTVDLRTLALFRIGFGLFLLGNLYDRTHGHNGIAFYTDEGILPSYVVTEAHYAHRWSLMYAVTTINQLRVALALIYLIYIAYTLGWHTRAMQVLAAAALISLDQRNLMLENGGSWVANIAVVATAFLPLGDRFSLDALRHARPANTSVVRLAYGFLMADLAVIYLFNGLAKTGAAWKDGTAIHLSLWYTRVESSAGAWLRMHEPEWFSPAFGRGTLYIEYVLPVLILSPILQRELRRTAIILIVGLHASLAIIMTLGPFAYVMMCMSILLVVPEDWDLIERWLRPRLGGAITRATAWLEAAFGPRAPPPVLAPQGEALRKIVAWLRDGVTFVFVAAGLCSLLRENKVLGPIHLKKMPEWAAIIVDDLRVTQSWHLFAPEPFRENATIVVDGEFANHEHVDPLTGRPPDFNAVAKPPLENVEIWREYLYRIGDEKNKGILSYFRDYLLRLHTLPDARIHSPLTHVDIYRVSFKTPPLGQLPATIQRRLLISGEASDRVALPAEASEPKVEPPTLQAEPPTPQAEPPNGTQSQ
jgi:hypothetical protein